MKPLPITIATLAASMSILVAQETPATDAPKEEKKAPMTLEERKESIGTIEEHIQERRDRLEEIGENILRMDENLEKKVDRIVNKLASLKDSKDSKYRVSQIKMRTMEKLVENGKRYQSKRAELIRELKNNNGSQPKDMVEGDVTLVEDRVEKRVEQILLLSKSFSQEDENIEKYTNTGYSGWGWGSNEKISDEYKQNRRDKSMNKKQRDEIMAALDKAITRYESLLNGVEQQLKREGISEEYKKILTSERDHYQRVLENRKRQKADFVLVEKPQTKSISQRAAQDIENALDDAVSDFQSDIRKIKQEYAEIVKERKRINKLEKNLEARKQWLKDYEAGKVQLPTE